MKFPAATLSKPSGNHVGNLDSSHEDETTFLRHVAKQIGVKELAFDMRVSDTVVKAWLKGTKPNPLERSRKLCEIARARNCGHMVPEILKWIGGGFTKTLTPEQVAALEVLAGALK